MKKIGLSAAEDAAPKVDSGLLTARLNRTDLARELTLTVDTLQRWETRRMGPPCVRVGRKVLYRMTKLVLWYLCDRHDPDYGCFLSQDQLAAGAEISRASLNVHLEKLEIAELIRRQRRVDEVTRKQKSTRYVLGFEDDFGGEPCPESGHGKSQNPCPESGH